jgi:ATP-dependent DNA ligase
VDFARTLLCDVTLDGELVGTEFIGFDVLELFGADITGTPFKVRRNTLTTVSPFRLVEHAIGGQDKTALFDRVLANDGAGVVFKRLDGIYQAGQQPCGFKFSFYRTEIFAMTDVDIVECSVGLRRDGQDCGRVRFPFNAVWPKAGELWEVRFDEITPIGTLLNPQLLMRRDDLGCDVRAAAWWW